MISDEKIVQLVMEHVDLRPKGIVPMLDLLRPIYQKSAALGHFGHEDRQKLFLPSFKDTGLWN